MDGQVNGLYEAVDIRTINGENVKNDNEHRPFLSETPVVSVDTHNLPKGRYVVVSKDHGRTIEDFQVGKKVIWGGNLPGDIYGDIDIKGSRNEIFWLERPDRSWRIRGLAEYIPQMLDREDQVSEILRQNGLPTTRTRAIYRLNDDSELPHKNGHYYPLKSYKEMALRQLRTRLTKTHPEDADSQVKSAEAWLTSREFMVEVRDMQVAERLRGISICQTAAEFRAMLEPVFNWLNVAVENRNSGLISGTAKPDRFTWNEADIRRYFINWLPEQMGIYVGRLHKLGLAHHNLSAQNWSLVGTVYDLDTVTGRSLGDTSPINIGYDLNCALGAIEELRGSQGKNYLSTIMHEDDFLEAQARFLIAYMTEKYGPNGGRVFRRHPFKITSYDYATRTWKELPISGATWDKYAKFGVRSIK